jgi:hypothetical protein
MAQNAEASIFEYQELKKTLEQYHHFKRLLELVRQPPSGKIIERLLESFDSETERKKRVSRI